MCCKKRLYDVSIKNAPIGAEIKIATTATVSTISNPDSLLLMPYHFLPSLDQLQEFLIIHLFINQPLSLYRSFIPKYPPLPFKIPFASTKCIYQFPFTLNFFLKSNATVFYLPASNLSASSGAVVFFSCSSTDNIPISLSIFILLTLHMYHIKPNTTTICHVYYSSQSFFIQQKSLQESGFLPTPAGSITFHYSVIISLQSPNLSIQSHSLAFPKRKAVSKTTFFCPKILYKP